MLSEISIESIETKKENNNIFIKNLKKIKKINLFRGIIEDLKRRLPVYLSDWYDSYNYRVIPSTIYIFFTNILPAIAFALDLLKNTNNLVGVPEVLLSSAIAGVSFGILAGQPLVIVGMTGPVIVLWGSIYSISQNIGYNTLHIFSWTCIWASIMHIIIAITNSLISLKYVTNFSCETFEALVAIIYLEKGIRLIIEQFDEIDVSSGLLSIILSLGTVFVSWIFEKFVNTYYFHQIGRQFIADYSTAIAIVIFSAIPHGKPFDVVNLQNLPTPITFGTNNGRPWIVDFWNAEVNTIFISIVPGIILTVLFYFDHNVSSIITQNSKFNLKKGASFHYDFLLLGIIVFVCGIFGLPPPNGLIPQAPLHTQSLLYKKKENDLEDEKVYCIEQRFTNTMQGIIIGFCLTPPLLYVLGLIPRAVLAGLFIFMGLGTVLENNVFKRFVWLFQEKNKIDITNINEDKSIKNRLPPGAIHPTSGDIIPIKMVIIFEIIEILCLGIIYYITLSPISALFPIFIILLFPIRSYILPKFYKDTWLESLDEHVASKETMETISGNWKNE